MRVFREVFGLLNWVESWFNISDVVMIVFVPSEIAALGVATSDSSSSCSFFPFFVVSGGGTTFAV